MQGAVIQNICSTIYDVQLYKVWEIGDKTEESKN